MKKRPKKDDKFRSTEVGALLEAIKAEIKPILEDIRSIKNKLDSIFEQVGKNTEDIQLIKLILKEHTKILNEHSGLLNEHSRLLNEHGRLLNEHSRLLNEHSGLLNRILEELKSKVDRKDFELLEKKVASLTG